MVTRKTILLVALGFALGVAGGLAAFWGTNQCGVEEKTREANTATSALELQTRINDWLEDTKVVNSDAFVVTQGSLNEPMLLEWLKSRDESVKDPGDLTLWLFSTSAGELNAAIEHFGID